MAEKILDEDLPVEINGEIVVFEKGMTKSEVTDRYQSLTGGFIAAGKSGVERLVGSLGAIPETFLGDVFSSQELLDEAGKEYKATREAVSEALPAPVTYKDVTEAYGREGLTGAIPDAYRFSVESIGQNLPYVAPAMVASKVASTELGLGVASYLSKAVPFLRTAAVALPPSVAKAGLGVAAGVGTLALQFFGDNLQRQYEVAQDGDPDAQVTPDQINSFTAALAAGPQAAMDYVVIALTGGVGRGPQIAAARSLKESLGAVGTTAKAATSPTLAGAARASFAESALEFPTELAQTVLERAQAGLSISPQDAEFVEEMIATVAGTIPMTGAFGSYGTVRSYRANKKAYDNWEKLSEQEKVIRNDYENRRQQSLQSEYDNSVRIYGDNVKEVEKKIQERGRAIEQGVQEARDAVELTADDVVEAADSRNIKTDDQAFKNFVYRTTGGQTSDINEADQDALSAMRTILTGFTVQNYYDADTEEGVSVPSFTSEELESVITGFKGGAKLTPETVRRKLHDKFYSKAKGRDQLVDFTDSESSNSIASSIIEEMKMRGYAVEDKNGNVKARKPKYTETQYRDLMERAYKDGSVNLRDYEQITGRFGDKNFQSFIDDAVIRGDMPSVQSGPMQRRGEFAPLVFRATLSEDAAQTGGDLTPITDKNGRPVIKATPDQKGGIKKRVTAGNVVTEVVEANGYFVRDGNGEIVGGATSRQEAAKEAKFLNENQSNYFITDQATGNITYGSKKKLDKIIKNSKGIPEYLRNSARAPDYTGVKPKLIRGAFSTDRNKSQGFAVRQFLSPGLAVKDKQTGKLENTGEAFGARRPSVTELSFAPDLKTASSVELEFAKETMPGAANWDKKVDEVGKQKRAELQELFDEEGLLFRPPPMSEVFAYPAIKASEKPSRISKRKKVLSEIKEYPVERGQEVLDLIENKLKEANLDKALIATIKDKIGSDGVTAEGSYSPNDDGFRRIAISLDQIKDAKTSEEVRIAVAGIMDHEIIHAMRDLDLFTMQEWNVLSNATYRVRNKDGQTFFERAAIDYEGKGDTNYILEEAVAEMYRQYYSVPEVRRRIAGQPRTLLERIAVFMEKMYNAMNGAGFVTSADVISSMKKIQAREAGEVRTIQGQRNIGLSGTPVETTEEEVVETDEAETAEAETEKEGDSLSSLENASDERLARVLDRAEPYTYIVDKNTGDKFGATFQSDAGSYFSFLANLAKDPRGKGKTWNIVFIDEERGMDVTDIEGGPGALRVLKTVLDLTKELVREKNPEGFNFAASRATKKKDEEQREAPARARLYARGIKDIAKEYGYSVEEVVEQFDTFFYAEKGDFKYEVQDERMSVAPAPTLTQGSPQSQWRIPSVNPVSRMDFTSRAVKDFNDERLAIAYHGSDVEFDKFQTRFIDGAQQRGWGLYFSDLVEVADFYRKNLTDEGVVYEVEIPEVDDLFDYDAPMVDQSPKVAEAFRKAFESENMSEEFDELYGDDGEESAAAFYDSLSFLGQREQYASELLSEYGIKGHYYEIGRFTPEIGSLGAKNFVIYDDESISIVKKLYQDKRPALDRDPDLSKRSEEIINGTRTGERLSVSNQSKVKKKEPRVQRDMEQLRNIFPARNEETFFETFNKALFQPDVAQLKKFLLRMRMKFVDQYTYLQKISEAAALKMKDNRDIRAATNAASLAMLSDRTNSLTAGAINDGAVVFRGGIIRVDHTKKSLKQALEPLFKADDDLYRDWGMWMVANRAQRIIKDGTLTPLSKTEIKTINEDIKRRNLLPMFEQVKSDYEEWNDSLVNVMKATGIINEELARVFKKYGDYIPFYRNMDMDAEGIEGVSPEVFKQILSAEGVDLSLGANRRLRSLFPTLTDQRPPKKMKGGDQQLVDPLTGIMQNLRAALMAGSKNLAAQRVMADAIDVGIATKVEPNSKGNLPAGAFTVRVNGEENYFTTDDDLLIETLMGFTQGKVNIHPFFSGPANLLREMVARSPLFLLRNPLRDSVSVWATSGANMTPVIDTMKRFASEVGEKSEEYKILRGAGVIGGYDYVFEPKKFEKSFRSKMRREGMTTKKNSAEIVTEPFRKVWDKLGDISQVSDAATRLEIYEDTLQNLLNKGVDRAEAETEAIFQAQETLNFSRRGNSAALSYIMPALPFFNTRIQGLDQMYRSLRGQYKSNRDGEVKAMNSFLARGGQIAAASIAYAMLSQDDEEYKAASQAERDENWIIGGVKIPTPFETGFIFKTIPERLYRALVTGDDTFNEGYDALKRGLVNAFEIPLAGPQALAPAVEVVFNHSLYTGRPVVPQYMEDSPPELQYKYYTSEFSRVIGETFNVSPLQVEHVIKGYTGTIGSYILGVADFTSSIARGKPVMLNWRSDELPLIGSLFQSAEASGGQQQIWNDFYFSVRGIGAALNRARNEPELQKDIMERYSDVLAVKPRVEKINTRINNLRAQRKNILLSQQISDDQKRAMLDSIDKSIKDIIASTSSLRSLEPGPIPFFRDIN